MKIQTACLVVRAGVHGTHADIPHYHKNITRARGTQRARVAHAHCAQHTLRTASVRTFARHQRTSDARRLRGPDAREHRLALPEELRVGLRLERPANLLARATSDARATRLRQTFLHAALGSRRRDAGRRGLDAQRRAVTCERQHEARVRLAHGKARAQLAARLDHFAFGDVRVEPVDSAPLAIPCMAVAELSALPGGDELVPWLSLSYRCSGGGGAASTRDGDGALRRLVEAAAPRVLLLRGVVSGCGVSTVLAATEAYCRRQLEVRGASACT